MVEDKPKQPQKNNNLLIRVYYSGAKRANNNSLA